MAREKDRKGQERTKGARDLTQPTGNSEAATAYGGDIINSMLDGVVVVDSQGAVVDVNDAVARMSGYTKEEILSSPPSTFWAARDIPKVTSAMVDALAGTPFPSFEMAIVTKDGAEFPVSATANLVRDAQGNPTALVVVLRDIRETKKLIGDLEQRTADLEAANEELRATEEELRATNEELQAVEEELRTANEELQSTVEELKNAKAYSEGILQSMVDGLGVIDLQGTVLDVNHSLARMMGCAREELVGAHFSRILGEKDMPRFMEANAQVLAGTPLENFEMEIPTKNGAGLPVSVTSALLKDRQGNPTAVFAVLRDIKETKKLIRELEDKNTELQASEEELRATNEKLEAANEELREAQDELVRSEKLAAVGQLASGVGHELRNPLGAIRNAVFYVKRQLTKGALPLTDTKVPAFLDIIDGEVDAANKVISDLLGFSRVAKPTISPANIRAMIEDALSYVHLTENVELVTEVESGLPMVQVDADQIRQVFTNMMLNAQEAMPEGGQLTITARAEGKFVEVRFADTGCGLPESIMSKIFDPLFTTKAKGVGLGLSVCHSIVERHGGSIKVGSEEGKGTTFSVLLPIEPDRPG